MNAKKCRYCNTNMPSNFRTCPYCGRRQPMSIVFLILLITLVSMAAGFYLLLGDAKDKPAGQDAPAVESSEPAEGNVELGVLAEEQPDEMEKIKQSEDAVRKAEEERPAREKAENERRLREEAARIKAERERFEKEQAEKKRKEEEEALKKKAAEEKMSRETVPVTEGEGTASTSGADTPIDEKIIKVEPAIGGQPAGPEPGSTTTEQQSR